MEEMHNQPGAGFIVSPEPETILMFDAFPTYF
jgi:hypothetical protein